MADAYNNSYKTDHVMWTMGRDNAYAFRGSSSWMSKKVEIYSIPLLENKYFDIDKLANFTANSDKSYLNTFKNSHMIIFNNNLNHV